MKCLIAVFCQPPRLFQPLRLFHLEIFSNLPVIITVFLPASPFIPISPLINFRDFCQPPRLLFWPKFTSFPVYSALPFYLKLESTSIRLHVEQIFSLNIEYTSFFNFGRGFFWACDSFTILFPKVPAYCGKRN